MGLLQLTTQNMMFASSESPIESEVGISDTLQLIPLKSRHLCVMTIPVVVAITRLSILIPCSSHKLIRACTAWHLKPMTTRLTQHIAAMDAREECVLRADPAGIDWLSDPSRCSLTEHSAAVSAVTLSEEQPHP